MDLKIDDPVVLIVGETSSVESLVYFQCAEQ